MSSPLEGTFLRNRYTIQRHIATGGMAAVFLGWDYRIERPVAIKVLRQLEAATPRDIERFQREAQAAATLNHPHVVQVYDFFEENGCCFLVMEYVEGVNLKTHLRSRGPLPHTEALALGEQVCAALEAAHAGGFIHRDIKPQNVLLDRDGWAKLTDFGIVQVLRDARMTTTGAVLGTADYIAPEQARGEALTPASDLYALGVVLYELLTGRLPFIGRTPLLVATQHATAPVIPPDRFVPDLSPYVQAVVLRALRKDPDQRYQTAARMRLALRLAREAATLDEDAAPAPRASEAQPDVVASQCGRGDHPDAAVALAEAVTVIGAARGQGGVGKQLSASGPGDTCAAVDRIDGSTSGHEHAGAMADAYPRSALVWLDPTTSDHQASRDTVSPAQQMDARTGPASGPLGDSAATRTCVALVAATPQPRGAIVDAAAPAEATSPHHGLPSPGGELRWRRLGLTALTALALLLLFLLLGLWVHAPDLLARALP